MIQDEIFDSEKAFRWGIAKNSSAVPFPTFFYIGASYCPDKEDAAAGKIYWEERPEERPNRCKPYLYRFKLAEVMAYEKDHPEVFTGEIKPDGLTAQKAGAETEAPGAGEESSPPDKTGGSGGGGPQSIQVKEGVTAPRLLKLIKDEADKQGLSSKHYITQSRSIRYWKQRGAPDGVKFTSDVLKSEETAKEFARAYIADCVAKGASSLAVNAKTEVRYSDKTLEHNKASSPEDVLLAKEALADAQTWANEISAGISARKKNRKEMRKSGRKRSNGYLINKPK
jgi:hypothetical protein